MKKPDKTGRLRGAARRLEQGKMMTQAQAPAIMAKKIMADFHTGGRYRWLTNMHSMSRKAKDMLWCGRTGPGGDKQTQDGRHQRERDQQEHHGHDPNREQPLKTPEKTGDSGQKKGDFLPS